MNFEKVAGGGMVKPTKIPGGASALIVVVVLLVVACTVGGWVAYNYMSKPDAQPVSTPAKPVEPPIDVEKVTAKAEAGDAMAQKELGRAYARGLGVKQSYAEAAKWYKKGADQGNASAQVALGELYETGQGVKLNDEEAAKLYKLAADQGNPGAQYSLAMLYILGKGVPMNDGEAVKLLHASAEHGEPYSQYNLGMRYAEGHNIGVDLAESFKWLSLAGAQGLGDATNILSGVKGKMSSEQLAEGKKRLASFVMKNPPAAAK